MRPYHRTPSLWGILLCTLLVLGCYGITWAEQNLLTNPGFELPITGELPPGWQKFSNTNIAFLSFEPESATNPNIILTIKDESNTAGYGLRSMFFPAEPGQVYRASVKIRSGGGTGTLYLDFTDDNGSRVSSKTITSRNTDWETVTVTHEAPPGTTSVSIILYSQSTHVGHISFDDAVLTQVSADTWMGSDVEVNVGPDALDYAPADGAVVTTNPPSFIWVPVSGAASYTLEFSTSPTFAPAETITVRNIDLSIYTPDKTLDNSKTWYWRLSAVDRNGKQSPYTNVRAFNIDANAVELPLPPLDQVRAAIPKEHPRLFVTPDTLEDFKGKPAKEPLFRVLWNGINVNSISYRFAILPDEPPHCYPNGVWDVNLWRQYTITTAATQKMETLAFAYMMTGDKEVGEAARKWMLHIASWDPGPNGATSAKINDESSMPILYQMSRAYTWAYDALSEADRQKIREVMRIRGNEAYQILKARPFEYRPYGSHAGRSLGFLGEAAIAFLDEIPEAAEWFDYVVRIFYAVYPAWGKDAGGWAEGHAYWTSYMNRVFWFVDAFQAATGLNLYEKAFFKNTGTFKLYTQPPYSTMGPFGDFADRGPTSSDGNVMGHLAAVYGNPYYKWYAEATGSIVEMGVMGYIRAYLHDRLATQSQSPLELPPSAYFSDIGWVVFHKQLGDTKGDLQFMFKSSPYGSYSHSFADQNTFTLEAYGEPLAISSGYRPWYGSIHHSQYTKTTQAHNGLLVNGQGQIPQSLAAKGNILSFINGQSFDYTAGDAAQAYSRSLLDRYVRHAVYLRPDLYVVFDDVAAPRDSSYTWLLHTYHQMEINEADHRIVFDTGKARLDTRLWSSSALQYKQTDQFPVPLDEPMDKPVQWHLQATTMDRAQEAYFLAVLAPSRTGVERDLKSEPIAAGAGEGLRLQEGQMSATVLFRRGTGLLSTPELQADGAVAAWSRQGDDSEGLLLVNGVSWRSDQGVSFTSSVAVDVELTCTAKEIVGSLHYPAVPGTKAFDVTLVLPGRQVSNVVSSGELTSWAQENDTLTLRLEPGEHKLSITLQ
ncbi:MAG: DUF4962 domain-containing protein [Limnochordia bacterium]|jgi:hypothetical protein